MTSPRISPGAHRYRVWIDDQCIGSGQCELVDPTTFTIGDEGIAVVIGDPELTIPADDSGDFDECSRRLATLRAAAGNCPIGAVHVDEIT